MIGMQTSQGSSDAGAEPVHSIERLIATKDWGQTSLGPASAWPSSLQTVLRLMLTSRYSMWLGWGPDLVFFCNEAYRQQTLGARYPRATGKPFREVWPEVWDDLEPRVRHVLTTGEATLDEGLLLFLHHLVCHRFLRVGGALLPGGVCGRRLVEPSESQRTGDCLAGGSARSATQAVSDRDSA